MNTTTTFVNKNHLERGTEFLGSHVYGWARWDTSPAGSRHVGLDTYHTAIVLKLEDGRRVFATLVTLGKW